MFSKAVQFVVSVANKRLCINTTVTAGSALHGRMPENHEWIVAWYTNLKCRVMLLKERNINWIKLLLRVSRLGYYCSIPQQTSKAVFLPWPCACFSSQSAFQNRKKPSSLSQVMTFNFDFGGPWFAGISQIQYTIKCHVDLCMLVTCDGRQGSGVGIGQRHISFIRLRQVGVAAELLFLGQLEGDRDHTKHGNNNT